MAKLLIDESVSDEDVTASENVRDLITLFNERSKSVDQRAPQSRQSLMCDLRASAMDRMMHTFDDAWPTLDAAGRRERLVCCVANDLLDTHYVMREALGESSALDYSRPFPIYPGGEEEPGYGRHHQKAERLVREFVSDEDVAESQNVGRLRTTLRERFKARQPRPVMPSYT